jgi:hypothetical protein
MPDPVSRLEFARNEVDRVLGQGYSAVHPEVVVAIMQSAASDWAASRLAVAVESVAQALLVEEEAETQQRIVRPGFVQMRP